MKLEQRFTNSKTGNVLSQKKVDYLMSENPIDMKQNSTKFLFEPVEHPSGGYFLAHESVDQRDINEGRETYYDQLKEQGFSVRKEEEKSSNFYGIKSIEWDTVIDESFETVQKILDDSWDK